MSGGVQHNLNQSKREIVPNWNPVEYARISEHVQTVEATKLLEWHNFSGRERILDIGCGDGGFTINTLSLKIPHGRVIGFDKDVEMHEHAVAIYPENICPHARFLNGDVLSLGQHSLEIDNFLEGKPDLIFSSSTMHHLYSWRDHEIALNQIYTIAKDGAVFVCAFAGHGNFGELRNALDKVAANPPYQSHFENFHYPLLLPTADAYGEVLGKSGFVVEKIELIESILKLPDAESLAGWIRHCMRSYNVQMSQASDALKDAFAMEGARTYIEDNGLDVQKEIPFTVRNIYFRAKKLEG